MAFILRSALFEAAPSLSVFRRFRGKINVRKPRVLHFEKALLFALTKPIFINPRKGKTPAELCKGFKEEMDLKRDEVDNPLQRIIARELLEQIKGSRLVVFLHMNPIPGYKQFKAMAMFKRLGMDFKQYGRKTIEMAVEGTQYEAIQSLYVSQNMLVCSPEPDIKQVFKICRRFPQLIILAGIFEGKFVNKDELVKYSEIPDLQTAQSGLVQTLTSLGSTLVAQLNTHQANLVSNLGERVKQLQVEEK